MGKLGGERHSVQNPLIQYVSETPAEYSTSSAADTVKDFSERLGWTYITSEDSISLRGGETGLVFREMFIEQIQRLNPSFMDHDLAEELIKRIERVSSNIEGNLLTWEYLKGIRSVFVPQEKRERNVKLLDTEDVDKNTFHVTDEFVFTNGSKTIKADVVFLINGVPVFIVETKAAHKIEGIAEGLDQLRRYHREGPELMVLSQVYALTHIIRFCYGPTWNTSRKGLLNWKDEATGNYEELVKSFFSRERIIEVLTDFILFTRKDDKLEKIVLRPHQMRAVGKLIERAEKRKIKRGLIWHTQGSGKTYTMIVTAKKLMDNPLLENPTVIMLVDRNELEQQLFINLESVGFEEVPVADSKADLQNLLKHDTRGLIVSMIHKFEGIPDKVNTRDNIFVLVDEAHRTTSGTLGNYLMGALPNATYIGFTGTPVDKTSRGKSTFRTFGSEDPPKGYLDKYSILESIEDGATVPLHYTLAPNDLRVDKDTLDKEFLELADAEGISDQDELNKVLEKAVTLKNLLKNKDRVDGIAKHVANHFKTYVEPMGYKAFLVAVDRESCAIYKEQLDKHLPREYSQVVISPAHNDPPELSKYHLSESEEKKIRKKRSYQNSEFSVLQQSLIFF